MDPITSEPGLTDVDSGAALEAVREIAGDDLRAFVEYDEESYNPLYIAGRVVDDYGDPERVNGFAERLHYNYKLDFTEREMYEDLYEPLGGIRAFAVHLADQTIVRYVGDREGIFVSIDGGTSTDRVIDALTDLVRNGG